MASDLWCDCRNELVWLIFEHIFHPRIRNNLRVQIHVDQVEIRLIGQIVSGSS